MASLANANPTSAASVSWLDDDGTSHLEPLWLLVELPDGNPTPSPDPELELLVDRYSGSFVRIRASSAALADGASHPFVVKLATAPGPGGAVFASTTELRGMGGSSPAWWDQDGTLGKVRDQGGRDVFAPRIADTIDSGLVAWGHLDRTDPTHPALVLDHPPGEIRKRATLGDLVSVLEPVRVLTIRDVGQAELDVVGTAAYVPPSSGGAPGDPWSSGVTPDELARALAVPAPGPGPAADRLALALATAEDAVAFYTGRHTVADWPSPIPPGARTAVLQVAVRVYRAADVTFGVLATELGTVYTGRWITPEVSMALLGRRRSFGVA
jgi:hypothetical protein